MKMKKGNFVKFLAVCVTIVMTALSITACGSRLDGTYILSNGANLGSGKAVYSYIRFSDGKIYHKRYDSEDFGFGLPYKIKGGYIQETFIGVEENEFAKKGDHILYDGNEYVSIKSSAYAETIKDISDALKPFDGVYAREDGSGNKETIIIDSKNKKLTAANKEIDLFFVEIAGNKLTGKLFNATIFGNSLLYGDHEFVLEGKPSAIAGVYVCETIEYNGKPDGVPMTSYIVYDEPGKPKLWEIKSGESPRVSTLSDRIYDIEKIDYETTALKYSITDKTLTLGTRVFLYTEGATVPQE